MRGAVIVAGGWVSGRGVELGGGGVWWGKGILVGSNR